MSDTEATVTGELQNARVKHTPCAANADIFGDVGRS